MTDKQTLRRDIKTRIANLSAEDRRIQSEQLCARLVRHPAVSAAKTIGIFLPLPDEPDLTPFYTRLAQPLALPVEESGVWVFREITNLHFRGSENHGIRLPKLGRPINASELDVILVPGRAFTPEGHRLGRGKGIYDRLLLNTCALTLGIAFDVQILPALPQEHHDLILHEVLR